VIIPFPLLSQTGAVTSDPIQDVVEATIRSPQVSAAAATAKGALALTKSGRSTTPAQLYIAPWLGSPNGTTEEFLFLQPLEAGGRRRARVSSLDVQLVDAQTAYLETVSSVYVHILSQVTSLAAAERNYSHTVKVEKNLEASLKVIEAQVAAGAKPGSDIELLRAHWNEAHIVSVMASEHVTSSRIKLAAYGLDVSGFQNNASSRAIPNPADLVPTNLLERRGSVTLAKLASDMQSSSALGRPDVSLMVRSQNFTRNFTPNDRGVAVQFSIPMDHGSIKANTSIIASQLSSVTTRVNDDRSKQLARRKSIEVTIASIDTAIATTQQAVISPKTDYVAKMQRAYIAGTEPVMSYLDAQRSLHDSELLLNSLRDQRDQAVLQLIEQCGLLPNQLFTADLKRNRK